MNLNVSHFDESRVTIAKFHEAVEQVVPLAVGVGGVCVNMSVIRALFGNDSWLRHKLKSIERTGLHVAFLTFLTILY